MVNKYLRHILNPDVSQGERNQIDLNAHLANGGILCVCTAKLKLRELSRLLKFLFCIKLYKAINHRKGDNELHVVSIETI